MFLSSAVRDCRCETQNAINLSRVRKEQRDASESRNDSAEMRDKSSKSRESGMAMLYEDNVEFLRRIERVVKFEIQQHRDELIKRMDRKFKQLWSAFDNFKHNFHLNRDYCRCDYVDNMDNDDADSIKGSLSDLTSQAAKFDLKNES